MSFNRFSKTREQRLARIAKQKANTTTDTTQEEPIVAEEVPLADEVIPIEEVVSEPVEQPEQVVTPKPRTTQNILDSIVGMLFAQHHQQIHGYMLELEKQILADQKALLEKHKLDTAKTAE